MNNILYLERRAWCFLVQYSHSVSIVKNCAVDLQISKVCINTVHCSTYSAVQCSAVQCSAVQCSTVQYSTVQYSTVQYSTVQYSTVQYSTVQCSALQCSAVQCSAPHYTTLHYTTLHYTTLHYTTLHYTTLHYTTLHYTTLHYTKLHDRSDCTTQQIIFQINNKEIQQLQVLTDIFIFLTNRRYIVFCENHGSIFFSCVVMATTILTSQAFCISTIKQHWEKHGYQLSRKWVIIPQNLDNQSTPALKYIRELNNESHVGHIMRRQACAEPPLVSWRRERCANLQKKGYSV